MATTIITKNGSGAPLAGDLTAGELAVDLTNKRLYSKDSGGNVIELGTNAGSSTFTDLTVSGDLTVDTNTLYVDSTNNRVGIGLTAPSTALHVKGADPVLTIQDNAGTLAQVEWVDSSGNTLINMRSGGTDFVTDLEAGGSYIYRNAGSEQFRIDSSGNVGIGATTVDDLLHLEGANAGIKIEASDNDKPHIDLIRPASSTNYRIENDSAEFHIEYGAAGTFGTDIARYLSDRWEFHTSGSERIRIDSSGNVGIGTSSPSTALDVSGDVTFKKDNGTTLILENSTAGGYAGDGTELHGAIHFKNNDSSGDGDHIGAKIESYVTDAIGRGNLEFYTGRSDTDLEKRMTIDSGGNLLVGRTSGVGSERLAVQGAALVGTFYSANSTANGTLMSYYSDVGGTQQQVAAMQRDGDILNANNTYGALSDERLKSNIVDASSQLDDIMAVQVRRYTLNATGETHIGVVAQELEASGMSGLVGEDEEGMKSVKYSVLYMKAIKALQEAVTRIETLEAEVAALKGAN